MGCIHGSGGNFGYLHKIELNVGFLDYAKMVTSQLLRDLTVPKFLQKMALIIFQTSPTAHRVILKKDLLQK